MGFPRTHSPSPSVLPLVTSPSNADERVASMSEDISIRTASSVSPRQGEASVAPSQEVSRYNLRNRTGRIKPFKYSHVTVSQPPYLQHNDPKSYRKAMASDDHVKWKQAVDKELRQIEDLAVWEDYVGQPRNPLRTVWIFRTKPSTASSPEPVKKARICIQGFRQIPEQDFFETFAPTGKYPSLLGLLTLAIDKQLMLRQFDVKAAFLYAPLDEEIVIFRPDG